VAEIPNAKPLRRGQVRRGKKSSKRWGFNGKNMEKSSINGIFKANILYFDGLLYSWEHRTIAGISRGFSSKKLM